VFLTLLLEAYSFFLFQCHPNIEGIKKINSGIRSWRQAKKVKNETRISIEFFGHNILLIVIQCVEKERMKK
jgi:hypothetical protein